MGHDMNATRTPEGGWPGGWLVALVAGLGAAILARWIGDVPMVAAGLVWLVVFLVFAVVLGMYWTTPAPAGAHDDHAVHDHNPVVAPMAMVQARKIALVIVVAALGWILVEALGGLYGWPPKYIFLADLSAAAAFIWAMVAAYRIWRRRHL